MTDTEQAIRTTAIISMVPAMEHRRNRRYLCIDGSVLRLSIRPEFRGRRALLVNVSTGGIGFLLEDPLEPETMLVFEWKTPGTNDAIARIARVRHSREHATPADAPWLPPAPVLLKMFRRALGLPPTAPDRTAWLVGCEFDQPLEEKEIAQFLHALESGPIDAH